MKIKKSTIQLAMLSCVLLLPGWTALAEAQEIRKAGRYYIAEITKSFKVSKGGSLRIYEIRGDVEIEAWAKNEVFVREIKKMDVFTQEEAETVLSKSESSYRQEGNHVEIGGEYYRRDWIQSEFMISIPASFQVDVTTRGGDIRVRGVEGPVDSKTSGGDITLRNIGGEIDAKTSGGDIVVEQSRSATTLKTSGGDLTLSDIGGRLFAKTSGGDIELKRANKGVEVRTSGGSIDIGEVNGELSAHTSGGDIRLVNVAGNVDVNTSGGDIDFRKVGGSLEASTSGGDIQGDGVQGSARVSTAGGDIQLNDVRGGVDGRTAGGDIEVEITLKDFSKPHGVDLRTVGGNITVYLPEKIPAQIRAEIELRDRWEDYNIYSDFPLTSNEEAEEEEGDSRRRRRGRRARFITSSGSINGGGDLIELSTTNGNIYIKKLR